MPPSLTLPHRPLDARGWTLARAAVLVLGAALGAAPLAGHSDEVDPHTYTVLARRLAESGDWLDPSYLPAIFHRFREHLPFGLWPFALAIRLFGERALAPLALSIAVGVLAAILWLGAPAAGRTAALVAALVLACTESFFRYAAQPRLDGLLLLLTAAATLPLCRPAPLPRVRWAWAAALTALAVLVKGPFGLVPLVAASCARALVLRRGAELLTGFLCAAVAALPAAAFLGLDAWLGDGSWWRGYGLHQLVDSALGARGDGEQGLVPLRCIAGRFWPGLPLAGFGLAVGCRDLLLRRRTTAALLTVLALVSVALLLIPSRRIWHHALVVFPALALLAGVATAPLLEKLRRGQRAALRSLLVAACAALVAAALGAGAWLTPRTCVLPARLARAVPVGASVLVVAPAADWTVIAALAAELRLDGWPAVSFGDDVPRPAGSGGPAWALVRGEVPAGSHSGFRLRGREGEWTLWTRAPD